MAAVLNLDLMQTMARAVRESFVSQALLCVLLLGVLKVVVASWRCVLRSPSLSAPVCTHVCMCVYAIYGVTR